MVLDIVPKIYDYAWYLSMADGKGAMSPYCYRPGGPWIAGHLGLPVEQGFFVMNLTCAFACFWLFFRWLRALGYSAGFSGACVALWVASSHSPLAEAFLSYYVDPPATVIGLLGILAVERKQEKWLIFLMMGGAFFRDSILFVAVYGFWRHRWWRPLVGGCAVYASILWTVRPTIRQSDSYIAGWYHTWAHYLRNPFNLTASWWWAFGPLGFLWIFGWRLDRNLAFFVGVGIVSCLIGGLGTERFWNWWPAMIPLGLLGANRIHLRMALTAAFVSVLSSAWVLFHMVLQNIFWWESAGCRWPMKLAVTGMGLAWIALWKNEYD